MSSADTRGFVYALDAAHQRARQRVDVAVGAVDRCRQALSRAKGEAEQVDARMLELAQRARPVERAAIDPARTLAVALNMQAMRQQAAEAARELNRHEEAMTQARRRLDQALIEREALEAHRAAALQSHLVEVERRRQAALDHDWLARRHWQRSASTPGRPQEDER